MRVGTLSQLWRFPVKSMGGERLESAALTWRGIPGDRSWAVYDETRSGITSAKRLPALRACKARCTSETAPGAAAAPVEISVPGGAPVASDSPEAARRLSEHCGRPLSLRAVGPPGTETDPRVTLEGEPAEMVRALMGILPDEPMPDLSAFPPEHLRELRRGNFFDAMPIHLLTRTTLRTLESLAPESAWDVRRFRPNLLVEADDGAGYPELGWLGRRIRVGTAEIELVTGCPRCVVVTQADDDLPQDHRVMRTLVRETKHTAGIYARVAKEGTMRVGDAVEVVGERAR